MNKGKTINMGTLAIDPKDPRTRPMMHKFLHALLEGDTIYKPFRRAKKGGDMR